MVSKWSYIYSFRRKILKEERYPLKDVLLKYLFVFDRKQVQSKHICTKFYIIECYLLCYLYRVFTAVRTSYRLEL